MQTTPINNIPVFENTGLTELEKAWEKYANTDTDTLIRLAEENYEQGIHAVALFLANKILAEKKVELNAQTRLRFIRAQSLYEFKFFRQALPDYKFYVAQQGSNEELERKMRYCRRMIHTGNNGSLLFVAVFGLACVLMFWALYYVQKVEMTDGNGNKSYPFENLNLNIDYILYSGVALGGLLVFGLFYRYVVIARMK